MLEQQGPPPSLSSLLASTAESILNYSVAGSTFRTFLEKASKEAKIIMRKESPLKEPIGPQIQSHIHDTPDELLRALIALTELPPDNPTARPPKLDEKLYRWFGSPTILEILNNIPSSIAMFRNIAKFEAEISKRKNAYLEGRLEEAKNDAEVEEFNRHIQQEKSNAEYNKKLFADLPGLADTCLDLLKLLPPSLTPAPAHAR